MNLAVPTTNSREPGFNFGLFGLILLGLGFLCVLAYFLLLAFVADEIVWDMQFGYCATCGITLTDPAVLANYQFGYMANILTWPLLIIVAYAIERYLGRESVP